MLNIYSKHKLTFLLFFVTAILLISNKSLNGQCGDNGNYWEKSWMSCDLDANPNPIRANSHWIMYDFHVNQNIDSSYIWNANKTGESQYGFNEVVVDYSLDGTSWIELGTYNFPQAPESSTYQGFEGPVFGGAYINKILFTVISTHGTGDCASLAEVQFKVTDEVCNGVLDECGVCDGSGAPTWYLDADGDGAGDANITIVDCEQPEGYVDNNVDLCDDGTLAWAEMATLFDENNCTGCHNSLNPTSGLDLETYAGFSMGGNNCGPWIRVGTTLAEIIEFGNVSCENGVIESSMNLNVGFAVSAEEIAQIQEWIDSGAPEYCDEACDSVLDECGVCEGEGEQTWYADLDQDGLGDPSTAIITCFPPSGYTNNGEDDDDDCFGLGTGVCSNCDGIISNQTIEARAFLEGAYIGGGLMHTQLLDANLLPNSQPFNKTPWNYTGSESVSTFPANVTDWILIEARCIADTDQLIERKAAFIRNDGVIIAPNGSIGVDFSHLKSGEDYYLVIRSRNHLAIASDDYLSIPQSSPYDFTSAVNVFGSTGQVNATGDGYYALKAGDFISNGVFSLSDFNAYLSNSSLVQEYNDIDCNLDGNVTVTDYNLYRVNASAIGIPWIQY